MPLNGCSSSSSSSSYFYSVSNTIQFLVWQFTIRPHHYAKHKMQPIAIDVALSVLSVCVSPAWALQQHMNPSRCRSGCGLGLEEGGDGMDHPIGEGAIFEGNIPTHSNDWPNQDAVWVVYLGWPKELCVRWGPGSTRGRGNFWGCSVYWKCTVTARTPKTTINYSCTIYI